jgi:hypothetical protein
MGGVVLSIVVVLMLGMLILAIYDVTAGRD